MNHISQSMNRISQSMNHISQSMNRISQSMNHISQSMNRISQSINRSSQSLNRFNNNINTVSSVYKIVIQNTDMLFVVSGSDRGSAEHSGETEEGIKEKEGQREYFTDRSRRL